jgi:hypothetical protein
MQIQLAGAGGRESREWTRIKFLNWKFRAIRGQSKKQKGGRFGRLQLKNN